MNKKGFGKALTLLLSIFIIAIEIIVFHQIYTKTLDPISSSIQQVPQDVDDNTLLINILRTEIKDGTITDLIVSSYADNNYDSLKKQITAFVNGYYGQDYVWKLSINTKTIDNYITGIGKKKIYDSSVIIPLYSKEAGKVELSIYKK